MRGAIIGTSIVVAMGAAFTAEGHGPFALNSANTINTHVMLFQLFGLIVFASCFPLGLVLDQRNALQDELKLANQKLSDLAHRDGLTGLLNRRSFDEILESAWAHADSSGGILSLLYIDIDFFKRFNDTYGHQSGDDCLRSVARALVESVRLSTDCVARYGGEEFVIVLPEASENATRATAERIAIAIRDLEIRHDGSPVGAVTASFGVATARPCQGGSPSWLVHLADDALYAAKRAGRNRIETSHRTESAERVVA
jgi:diguanylate cyclase (GGDEF)-like protein